MASDSGEDVLRGPGEPSISGQAPTSVAAHILEQVATIDALSDKPLKVAKVIVL